MTNQHAPKLIELMRVDLGPNHKPTGNSKHYLVRPSGRSEFPPFVSLSIAKYEDGKGFVLLYYTEEGLGTDGWHFELAEALDQAEYEFGVVEADWIPSAGLK